MSKLNICPFCKSLKIYKLQNNYIKCSKCLKKISLNKYFKDIEVIKYFCNDINALVCSKELNLNYKSVLNRYELFRKIIASYLEELHYSMPLDNSSYEEYYYFTTRQKQKKIKSLYDAINIIGFSTNNTVFTLLMPKLRKTFDEKSDESFEKYLNWRKINSDNLKRSHLKSFWDFLEESLKKYKGINEENFFYYLKECEFKYNFSKEDNLLQLQSLYFKNNN